MIKLSYILPIYNVEKYLRECLDSIYSQQIPDDEFEVVCVNDCSPDNSRAIVLDFRKKHCNIILIEHKNNEGLSAARNTGVLNARGKYIWFVDSDDILLPKVSNTLCKYAFDNNLDVLLFNYNDVNENGEILRENRVFDSVLPQTGKSFMMKLWGQNFVYHMGYVWRFLLKREYINDNNFSFPKGEYWEDTVYFPEVILKSKRTASTSLIAYSYRHNSSSISGSGKVLSAIKIYHWCFKAGRNLIDFANDINDLKFSSVLISFAKLNYINSVPQKLLYANIFDIYNFAILCYNNKKRLLAVLSQYLNITTYYIIKFPYFMCLMILALKPIWKFYKFIKSKIWH